MRKVVLIGLSTLLLTGHTPVPEAPAGACGQPGQWLAPGTGRALAWEPLLASLAGSRAVLLGETHDDAADHRWQLHTLAALHGRRPQMAIGFEMFPRRLQPVLDEWVAGQLGETEFLKRVEWEKVWGFDAQMYLPLFHFARMHRLPMLALNVERSLVSRVEQKGWPNVPEAEREGLSQPAGPSEDYRRELRQVYEHHPGARSEAGFARFAEAQTVWDRAMAEAIAAYLKGHPDHLVVGILGAGHVRHGYGIAHQLGDLGIGQVANLGTWDQGQPCSDLVAGLADAVFVKAGERSPPPPPRLGIAMGPDPRGVRILQVVAGSVAEQAGVKAEDVLTMAAGRDMKDMQDVRTVIQRQAPGTWLPLRVRRGDADVELVARFPAD